MSGNKEKMAGMHALEYCYVSTLEEDEKNAKSGETASRCLFQTTSKCKALIAREKGVRRAGVRWGILLVNG